MKKLLIGIATAMLVLHQDIWLWENTNLVAGFMPTGLVYHACFSMAVAVLAVFAIRFAWPHDLVRWATSDDGSQSEVTSKPIESRYTIR